MQKAIIGKKIGMTQIFDETGRVVPVTLIQAGPCTVVQKKTAEKDGYNAIQLGYETVPERKLTKPELGHQKKAGIEEFQKVLKEFALEDCSKYEVGDKEDCNTYDFCVPLGIGYDFGHLTFDVRYQQGTVDVIKGDDEKTLNTLLCFNFGYKF